MSAWFDLLIVVGLAVPTGSLLIEGSRHFRGRYASRVAIFVSSASLVVAVVVFAQAQWPPWLRLALLGSAIVGPFWRPVLFNKFHLQGGRAGVITAREGKRVAELHWEMLVGELDLVVYGAEASWTEPGRLERQAIDAADLRRLAAELAREMGINVQLDLGGSYQVFRGGA